MMKWKIVTSRINAKSLRTGSPDVLLAILLASFVSSGSYLIGRRIDPVVFEYGANEPQEIGLLTTNIWFDGDLPKMAVLLNDRSTLQYSGFTIKHPLFWPTAYGVTYSFRRFGLDRSSSIGAFTALVAGIWTLACYVLFRLVTPRRLDAILFVGVLVSSACAMFWLVVPEVVCFSSLTIVAALCLAGGSDRHPMPSLVYTVVSSFTLSMTVTNWLLGIFLSLRKEPWRRALQITVNSFFIVSVLWGAQRLFFQGADFFLVFNNDDREFILNPETGGPLRITKAFVFHTMLMPEIALNSKHEPPWRPWYGMSVQRSTPGSGSVLGAAALVLWIVLLAIGVYGLIIATQQPALRITLAFAVFMQFALHLIYGRETFLYSLNFGPLLVSLAALGTRTRFRKWSLVLAAMLLATGGIHNGLQLRKGLDHVREIGALADSYKYVP